MGPVVDLGDNHLVDIAGLHFQGCSLAFAEEICVGSRLKVVAQELCMDQATGNGSSEKIECCVLKKRKQVMRN